MCAKETSTISQQKSEEMIPLDFRIHFKDWLAIIELLFLSQPHRQRFFNSKVHTYKQKT